MVGCITIFIVFFKVSVNFSKKEEQKYYVFGLWSEDKREINSKLLLKIVKTNLFNKGSNLIHGVSSNSEVSRSIAVQFSNSKVSNLVQLIHNFLDKGLSFSDVFSSLDTSQGSKQISQIDHQITNSINRLNVVLLVSCADLVESGKVCSELGEESCNSRDGISRFLQLTSSSRGQGKLIGGSKLINKKSKTSEGSKSLG